MAAETFYRLWLTNGGSPNFRESQGEFVIPDRPRGKVYTKTIFGGGFIFTNDLETGAPLDEDALSSVLSGTGTDAFVDICLHPNGFLYAVTYNSAVFGNDRFESLKLVVIDPDTMGMVGHTPLVTTVLNSRSAIGDLRVFPLGDLYLGVAEVGWSDSVFEVFQAATVLVQSKGYVDGYTNGGSDIGAIVHDRFAHPLDNSAYTVYGDLFTGDTIIGKFKYGLPGGPVHQILAQIPGTAFDASWTGGSEDAGCCMLDGDPAGGLVFVVTHSSPRAAYLVKTKLDGTIVWKIALPATFKPDYVYHTFSRGSVHADLSGGTLLFPIHDLAGTYWLVDVATGAYTAGASVHLQGDEDGGDTVPFAPACWDSVNWKIYFYHDVDNADDILSGPGYFDTGWIAFSPGFTALNTDERYLHVELDIDCMDTGKNGRVIRNGAPSFVEPKVNWAYGVSTAWHPRASQGETIRNGYDKHGIDANAGADFCQLLVDVDAAAPVSIANLKIEQPTGRGCGRRTAGSHAFRVTLKAATAHTHKVAHVEINGPAWDGKLSEAAGNLGAPIYFDHEGTVTGGVFDSVMVTGGPEVTGGSADSSLLYADASATIQSLVGSGSAFLKRCFFGRPKHLNWGNGVPDWMLKEETNVYLEPKRVVQILIPGPLSAGNAKAPLRIPKLVDGWRIFAVGSHVTSPSANGAITVQLHNVDMAADVLSTPVTIDATEKDSKDAATPAVIDPANDDVFEGGEFRLDVPTAGQGASGLIVDVTFQAQFADG